MTTGDASAMAREAFGGRFAQISDTLSLVETTVAT